MLDQYLFILILALVAIYFIIHNKHIKFVEENSPIYKEICTLNNTSHFLSINSRYSYNQQYKSKSTFDRGDLNQIFLGYLAANKEIFSELIQKINENRKRYDEYLKNFNKILNSNESCLFYSKYSFFRDIEKKLCEKIKLHPVTDVTFDIACSYTSPKGKNSYLKQYNYIELEPGVDALLHVSQISRAHVEKPSDVLKVGQVVKTIQLYIF